MAAPEFGLTVATVRGGDWAIVSASGELDVATGPLLTEALDSAWEMPFRQVADLSGISFMDSTGLSVLIRAHRRATDVGGVLRIVIANERVLRVLRVTRLDEVFAVYPTVARATAAPIDPAPQVGR